MGIENLGFETQAWKSWFLVKVHNLGFTVQPKTKAIPEEHVKIEVWKTQKWEAEFQFYFRKSNIWAFISNLTLVLTMCIEISVQLIDVNVDLFSFLPFLSSLFRELILAWIGRRRKCNPYVISIFRTPCSAITYYLFLRKESSGGLY